ncbi:hypothetical protein X797_008058 [Metarhizium robertsii]|uniref:Uncharacterized protein n=1 Tax=Metarhizium robertsii TaxID=568076 RepID=A0A014NBW5_9HYPO|nr:hypothetical protein X797_008058 [Metarhizium robertsii]
MQQGDRFLAYVLCTEEAVEQEAATVDDTEPAVRLGMVRAARWVSGGTSTGTSTSPTTSLPDALLGYVPYCLTFYGFMYMTYLGTKVWSRILTTVSIITTVHGHHGKPPAKDVPQRPAVGKKVPRSGSRDAPPRHDPPGPVMRHTSCISGQRSIVSRRLSSAEACQSFGARALENEQLGLLCPAAGCDYKATRPTRPSL